MATNVNFKISNGVTTSSLSNVVGLNITDDNTATKTDISYSSNNLNIKNKSATGSLILGTNDTAAVTIDNSQNVTIAGNLTVNGTTETINSTVTLLEDPIMSLGGTTAPSSNDSKDRGIEFKWHNGTSAKTGFFGYDNSTGYLTFIPDGTNTSEVYSGSLGDIQAANFRGALIGNASTATTLATSRNIALSGDVTGTVSFNGSADATITSSLSTSGVAAGTYKSVTVDTKGRVTAGTNPTTLSGYGITDALSNNNPTFTGTATLSNSGASNFVINGTTSTNRIVLFQTSTSNRWLAGAGADGETGSNVGSNFYISSFDDTGSGMLNRLVINRATGNVSFNYGLSLDNGTSNLIKFGNNGAGTPTFNTRTPGTKILIWDTLSASTVDYAIGFTGGTFWSSVPSSTDQFRWYGGTTVAATLTGAGVFTTAGDITSNGALIATANARVYSSSGSAGGTLYFGGSGKYLLSDGTSYSFNTGNVTVNGDLYATNFISTSDVRKKTNIEPIVNALDTVSQLNGKTFDMIDTGKHSMGLIAQELEEVIPYLVETDADGFKSVNYPALVGLLIESIKEIKSQLNDVTGSARLGA